jgi:hypothetical protein
MRFARARRFRICFRRYPSPLALEAALPGGGGISDAAPVTFAQGLDGHDGHCRLGLSSYRCARGDRFAHRVAVSHPDMSGETGIRRRPEEPHGNRTRIEGRDRVSIEPRITPESPNRLVLNSRCVQEGRRRLAQQRRAWVFHGGGAAPGLEYA